MKYTRVTIHLEPAEAGRELLLAWLSELPFDSFEEIPEGLIAYAPSEVFSRVALDDVLAQHFEGWPIEVREEAVPEVNWNEEWEKNFAPVQVGDRLLIRAPFHPPSQDGTLEVEITPRMSFGTGHHATTWLICDEMLNMDWQGKDVLDMGAGTGVLAILAAKLGAASVTAIDIDAWSVDNMKDNVARNGVTVSAILQGDAQTLSRLPVDFDVVIANINRNVLTADMDVYLAHLRPGGSLLLSGFFERDAPVLLEAARPGMELLRQATRDEWCMLHLRSR